MAKYTKPGILNAVRELSRFSAKPTVVHKKTMLRALKYSVLTKEKGLVLKSNKKWDGNKNFEFEITGKSNSTFAADMVTRHSVSGWSAFLNSASYVRKVKCKSL